MAGVGGWYLINFFRRAEKVVRRREPSGTLRDYLVSALLDTNWWVYRSLFRRSAETVLRAGAHDDRVVATLWVRVRSTLSGVTESVVLDSADYTIELEARRGHIANPTSKTYAVTFDGEAIGSIVVGPGGAVARNAAGDVARWLIEDYVPMQSFDGKTPQYGQLVGRVSGVLRVPLRRSGEPRDFNDHPFFADAEGDDKWLAVFLALAAAQSLTLQAL